MEGKGKALIRSMTAYGRAEHTLNDMVFIAELKSLNNRYRDIFLKIPRNFQVIEDEIRSHLSSRISRGRIELSLQVSRNGSESDYLLELNLPLVRSYLRILRQLSEEFGLEEHIGSDTLCQMKDVIVARPADPDIEGLLPAIHEVLKRAIDSLDMMKIEEGKAIEADFRKRLRLIEEELERIQTQAPVVVKNYRQRLRERIHRILPDTELDENRLLQEVALFAERSDITEEIVRIHSHLKQFYGFLSYDEPVGRRLDFLVQEIHREVNTISAKASDSVISAGVVQIKGELEKLREQIQNVE
jgi:uncharacterized protein (TIGR00255 family)